MKELILFGLTIFVTVFIFANRAPSSSSENSITSNSEVNSSSSQASRKRDDEKNA